MALAAKKMRHTTIVHNCATMQKHEFDAMSVFSPLSIVFYATLIVSFLILADGLNEGKAAYLGQFPFIVRIKINEEGENASTTENIDSGSVATGVLIKPTQVITTCDSVGFFTGQTVNLYNVTRVEITGGSVKKTGEGGVSLQPNDSRVHPYCYSLMVSKIVLFNYGMYEVAVAFVHPQISPLNHPFKNQKEMTYVMKALWEQRSSLKCETAGWGNPKKQFEGNGMPDHFERFAPILQTTQVKITTFKYCRQEICQFFGECMVSLWEYGFMCGQADKGGPCNEDNGAPLICGGTVIAIYSNPARCEGVGLPRPFLRLDLAYEFIYGTLGSSTTRSGYVLMFLTLWFSTRPYS